VSELLPGHRNLISYCSRALLGPGFLLYRDNRSCHECKLGVRLIATLRLFGLWALVLTSLQIAPAATAFGDESDVVVLLTTGRIKTSATWCYKKPGPERCGVTLHIKDGSLVLEGAGCGSFRLPVNGSNGRQAAKITGNTITVSVTGSNGNGVNTYELSPDLAQCSYAVECPAGFRAKVFSCSVERNAPTPAVAERRSPAIAALKSSEQSPPPGGAQSAHAARIDAQSYLDAAKDLKEREPTYNSLSAAVQTFRRAVAAFDAKGNIAGARAATDEAQALENNIKIAERRLGLKENQNQCGMLRGNALECYSRATRLQTSPSSEPMRVGQAGAFLDCVRTYCGAMQKANCPTPLFGKENAGFCFTAATDDPDVAQGKSSAPQ
jgi:hypothetical protein